ncbi:hypothetical protein EB796_003471 [Bugula neritina]|uniref:WSC domain-containing protein n=1 Tax=Bugula neritina TaxID=10212 RepID=A0A7J7KHT3_BUGNE|nr:hypothetical protein EB796_003471 [Bugula neritina]
MGDECHCGLTYNKYGSSNKCSKKCSGNSQQTCGGNGAFSVYSTFTRDVKVKKPMNQEELRDLFVTSSVDATRILLNIKSFMLYPWLEDRLAAVTSQQLVRINLTGDCEVLAGAQLTECSVKLNSFTFNSISHFISVDFSQLRDHSSELLSQKVFLVADRFDHCVKLVDPGNLEDANPIVIGQCSTPGRLENVFSKSLNDIRLTSPIHLSAVMALMSSE